MRSVKLIPTLVILSLTAAVTLLALGAAGASAVGGGAAKHPSPNGRCDVNINVAPRQIAAGDSVVVFGRLHCRGGSPNGAAQPDGRSSCSTPPGTPGFSVVQSTTTDAGGFYELTVAERGGEQRLLRALARRRERAQDGQGRPPR